MIQQLLAYLESYTKGQVSYRDFSTVMFLLRDIVEGTNVILDGTCAGVMNEQEIQAMVSDVIHAYTKVAVTVTSTG
jgi:hypothetical protein